MLIDKNKYKALFKIFTKKYMNDLQKNLTVLQERAVEKAK